jgi:hypothetical protein
VLKRIKYIKDTKGNFITKDIIKTKDKTELRAGFIGGDAKIPTVGFIKSVGDDIVNIQVNATSAHKIKIIIKEVLIKLGCVFSNERRVLDKTKPRKNKALD